MAREKRQLTAFERAFVSARRSGAKEFSFRGKKFNTKRKGEGGGKPAAQASTPKKGGGGMDAVRKSDLVYKAPPGASPDKSYNSGKGQRQSLKPSDINKDYMGKAKDVPTPTPKPSQSSGHMGGVVGRVGEIGKRVFQAPDPKTLFKGKSAETAVPKPNKIPTPTPRPGTPTPESAPKPTARPASPRERQAKRTEAYLTNLSGAPAVGESTFAKSVHGMENLRTGSRIQKIPNARGDEGNIQRIPNAPLKPTPPKFTQAAALTKQQRSDSEWNARDVADTRRRMEEAKTPRPGKTGGIPSENMYVRGTISTAKAPQGKVMDASTNRGIPSIQRPTAVKSAKVAASGKTARLPQNEARTTPKTGRLKKTTVVARR